jgi:hypothetical protein
VLELLRHERVLQLLDVGHVSLLLLLRRLMQLQLRCRAGLGRASRRLIRLGRCIRLLRLGGRRLRPRRAISCTCTAVTAAAVTATSCGHVSAFVSHASAFVGNVSAFVNHASAFVGKVSAFSGKVARPLGASDLTDLVAPVAGALFGQVQ